MTEGDSERDTLSDDDVLTGGGLGESDITGDDDSTDADTGDDADDMDSDADDMDA
ncbi:MAG: hypothetical protein M3321_12955 [Actinomycetota bacterium]|nr:hypothetical protein [Actinomycetota bacterium]